MVAQFREKNKKFLLSLVDDDLAQYELLKKSSVEDFLVKLDNRMANIAAAQQRAEKSKANSGRL